MTCKIEKDNVALRKEVRILRKALKELKERYRELLVSMKGNGNDNNNIGNTE